MKKDSQQTTPQSGLASILPLAICIELILFIVLGSLFSNQQSPSNFVLFLVIAGLVVVPIGAAILCDKAKALGDWVQVEGITELPTLPFTVNDALHINQLVFEETKVIHKCRLIFSSTKEIPYSKIKRIEIHKSSSIGSVVYFLCLIDFSPTLSLPQQLLGCSLSGFTNEKRVLILKLLSAKAPHAELDDFATHLKNGQAPAF